VVARARSRRPAGLALAVGLAMAAVGPGCGQGASLPASGDAGAPAAAGDGSAGVYRQTEVIGDTQIACNIGLEEIYGQTLTSAPLAAVAAEVQVTATGINHRCRYAFDPGSEGEAAILRAVIAQTGADAFDVVELVPIDPC